MRTLSMITEPSRPALLAIQRTGVGRARLTIKTPVSSSPSSLSLSNAGRALIRPTPPPGRIPSSRAARVAARASSTRDLRSFISVSVAAPTAITATPPAKAAWRSCSFSRSKALSTSSTWALICLMRSLMASGVPAPSMMTVLSLLVVTR